ncbi:exodeoxyribonuclease V subunit gamma [Thiothrix eikelboomii]|uniref:exodeoxyribonuclease V subunit gamma n=1 Tax=Thiothrix eikelboomii TaxID=92487 RepID=UPI003BB16101
MLYVHHSNRLETLAQSLAQQMMTSTADPFEPRWVVVQNAGMGRWLSMQVAQLTGVAAHFKYLFPAELTWELLRRVLTIAEHNPCSIEVLRWRLLQEFLQRSEQHQVALGHYLQTGQDDSAWQLAQQLAGVFDGYLFFRPDWVRTWESQAAPNHWQEKLWQLVIGEPKLAHWVNLQAQFIAKLASFPTEQLPNPIIFFSIPALSPAYIELIAKVAERVDIHFFIMNPSLHYWGDLESQKRRMRYQPIEQDYVSVGNPLLASWGVQGRDFIEILRNSEPYPQELENFFEPSANSLLHIIQNDILHLEASSAVTVSNQGLDQNFEQDRSICLHACHSPLREVEVLYDQLLAILERHPDLTAAEVVVMSPDINAYAPFIEAVFSSSVVALPFSIADQRFSQAMNISHACAQLLELPQGRFEAESIFTLLEYAEIRQHFGLDEAQVQQCREWVRAVNIRWGVDAEFRQQFARQTTFEHTWRYGLDRLLLGFALPGEQLLGGVLPYNELEGSQTLILERFQQCLAVLFSTAQWASQRASLADWGARFSRIVEQLFPREAETQTVYRGIDKVLTSAQLAGFTEPVAWLVFKSALRRELEQTSQESGFLGQGITFCNLMPMRSVPFRVVALLGMQDGGFPRQDNRLSFDLLAADKRRKGDRSRREEDRYLFLESLLSARDYFYISYLGQSIQDNSEIMPSVLVSELLDYLEKRFSLCAETLITRHPLQAFSPRYFQANPVLFTYAKDYLSLQAAAVEKRPSACFWDQPQLPAPAESLRQVSLNELIQFYRQPARVFLQRQFDLRLTESLDELAEREPFALEAFTDSKIGEQAVQHLQRGDEAWQVEARLRAQGLLPHGKPGELLVEQQLEQVKALLTKLPKPTEQHTLDLNLSLGEFSLHGQIPKVNAEGIQLYHFGYLGVWQWVSIWLQHLALNLCQRPVGGSAVTQLYTVDKTWRLPEITEATAELELLVEGYWLGLQQPLPFFPKSAWQMAAKGAAADEVVLRAGQEEWIGNSYHVGESTKPEYRLLYRGRSPFDEQPAACIEWAQRVFGRLIASRQER